MAAAARDLAKRLAAAVGAVTALSEAELREERQSEESGEEASVLALALRRVAAMLRASGAPAQEPATLKPLQKLLAVSIHALSAVRGSSGCEKPGTRVALLYAYGESSCNRLASSRESLIL
jgi:hypothetical protein